MGTFLLLLLILGFFAWLVIVVLGGTMGPSFNRFNPFIRSAPPDTLTDDGVSRLRHPTIPSCGRCGYPARGISTLQCPECGADLREVGITTGKERASAAGCMLPVAFSIAILLIAGVLRPAIDSRLPTIADYQYQIGITPNSQQYAHAQLMVRMDERLPTRPNHASFNHGISSSTNHSAGSSTTTLSVNGHGSTLTVRSLSLTAAPYNPAGGAWRVAQFDVDPTTRSAAWITPNGKKKHSKGVFTDQDVLAFLGDLGANTADTAVQAEARELHTLMDGLATGLNHFQLVHMKAGSMTSSSGHRQAPDWFDTAYLLFWLVFWIGGLLLIARRRKRQSRVNGE